MKNNNYNQAGINPLIILCGEEIDFKSEVPIAGLDISVHLRGLL